ncbi:MAG: septum formation protein Maf [Flavobacteriales bacterium TMED84]|nr:MAG: septum formation protein Maf [Flavobacteriales bacterium TMED84]
MLIKKINSKYSIILASNSPRRREILKKLGFNFNVRVSNYDENINFKKYSAAQAVKIIAEKKSFDIEQKISSNDLIITADTTVLVNDKILNKPQNKKEAKEMIYELSNNTHKVLTGVCIRSSKKKICFSSTTKVDFFEINSSEIDYYLNNFTFKDKAGSYAIQEWLGIFKVRKIEGCFFNVVGMPASKLCNKLNLFL